MSQFINGWRIIQQDFEWSDRCGKWYVACGPEETADYLHTDGSIHKTTLSPDGSWSGYFDTYEQAEAAAAKAPRQEVSP